MAKVLIVGVGDVGGLLFEQLLAAGHEVWGIRRHSQDDARGRIWGQDVLRPDTLSLPPALDYVFVLLAPAGRNAEQCRLLFENGVRNLCQALKGMSLRRLFYVSSTRVYEGDDGRWISEESPLRTRGAESLLIAEDTVRNADFNSTILRLSGIYGPERQRLVRWAGSGLAVSAEPVFWSNRIHREDAAAAMRFLLERDLLSDGQLDDLYLLSDCEPAPIHEILDALARVRAAPLLPRLWCRVPSQGRRIDNARLKALGYRFIYPGWREGYLKSGDWPS